MKERTKLNQTEIWNIQREFPSLPMDYYRYMMDVGWGESDSGHMIYSGPTSAKEIYGSTSSLESIVLLGDDFQGYCFGFDIVSKVYGEVSPKGEWQPSTTAENFSAYI